MIDNQLSGLPEDNGESRGGLLDREWALRQNRKQTRRMRVARFREQAVISATRGLDRSQVLALTQEDWIRRHLNVIVTAPTGAGKYI